MFKTLAHTKLPLKKWPKGSKNFAQSGHTGWW